MLAPLYPAGPSGLSATEEYDCTELPAAFCLERRLRPEEEAAGVSAPRAEAEGAATSPKGAGGGSARGGEPSATSLRESSASVSASKSGWRGDGLIVRVLDTAAGSASSVLLRRALDPPLPLRASAIASVNSRDERRSRGEAGSLAVTAGLAPLCASGGAALRGGDDGAPVARAGDDGAPVVRAVAAPLSIG